MTIVYNFLRSLMLPLREIDEILPERGEIIDLGCGEGVTAKYLARVNSRCVTGVDNNNKRLQNSEQKNLKFVLADIRKFDLKGADAIIISDVLHHLNYEEQKKLLNKIASSLGKDGVFLIKEIDTGEFVRSKLSRFWDFVFYPKDKIFYLRCDNLKTYLEKIGFEVTITRPMRLFLGSTTLFNCKKS